MNKQYAVSYEGWLIINAKDEDEAGDIACQMLGDSGIINDGITGEWSIASIDEEEEEEEEEEE
jgi:hypothetical protein